MYKDHRKKRPVDIEIDVKNYTVECFACPTIIDFKDTDGTNYHFRLRHGYARIVCEDTSEILATDNMSGFDGVCNWDDVVKWARNNGIQINY